MLNKLIYEEHEKEYLIKVVYYITPKKIYIGEITEMTGIENIGLEETQPD